MNACGDDLLVVQRIRRQPAKLKNARSSRAEETARVSNCGDADHVFSRVKQQVNTGASVL